MPHALISLVGPYAKREEILDSATSLNGRGGFAVNCMIMNVEGKKVVTQRPAIRLTETAVGGLGAGTHVGAGIWFRADPGVGIDRTYLFTNNAVYSTTYATNLGVVANVGRVWIAELDDRIVVNNANSPIATQYSIDDAILTTIVDVDRPVLAVPGIVQLDGYIFILELNSNIRNSDLGDELSWSALGTIKAERESARGRAIAKHHDHVVAFTDRTIEFFYNARNPTASPLSRRQDLAYNMGMESNLEVPNTKRDSFTTLADDIYFKGSRKGNVGIYRLRNFKVEKISNPYVDALIIDPVDTTFSSFSVFGKQFVAVTLQKDSYAGVNGNLVYDVEEGWWSIWDFSGVSDTSIKDVVQSPPYSVFSGVDHPHGIMANGDTFEFQTNERAASLFPFAAEDINIVPTTVPINMTVTTEIFDAGNYLRKKQTRLDLIGQSSANLQPQSNVVSWSDDSYQSFTSGKILELDGRSSTYRGGMFRRRAYRVQTFARDRIWLENIGIHYDQLKN